MFSSRLIAALLSVTLLGGCVTSDWDSGADLSMTDKDPWEYYSDVYLDYANGRLNIAIYDKQPPVAETATRTGSSTSGPQLAVFFDDVLVRTHSLENLKATGGNINSSLFCDPEMVDTGPLKMDPLPMWISKQLSNGELELHKLAVSGDEAARKQFTEVIRNRVETPWATGLECVAEQFGK